MSDFKENTDETREQQEHEQELDQEQTEAIEKPLIDDVSEDIAPVVQEFIAEATESNEAEGEAALQESAFQADAGFAGAAFASENAAPYIAFENVSKSFGDFVVLENVSFFVNTGETLCILGRSGVGKSVSLQLLMGFLKPDSGTVLVAGQNIAGMSEREMQEVRHKVTMVFQNGALFDSITVGENVAFPLRERGDMEEDQILQVVRGLLEMVGVSGMEDMLPSDLSTGMKRSVAIARALAAQPAAILYDEPTTMVDPLMAHLLGDLIQRLKMQIHLTSIVVTHDMRFAEKLADRLMFLHEGTVRFFGTTEEMRRSTDPVLREFFSMDELVLPV
ncbi:MAG: ATP-binding cassette domain-containing protein [Acidobacteria bacterium]|nr:ATP-binding cassette domain-containing protein [Acidobacteriota bacterium]